MFRLNMFYCYSLLVFLLMHKGGFAITFTLVNGCGYTVWPGILANSGAGALDTTGFELPPLATQSIHAPPGWSGRLWGRTGCSFDPATGQGGCSTGDCGSGGIQCNGAGAKPPATLAEFKIGGGSGDQDFYDVSLVDGYNLPMIVVPTGGTGGACGTTGCVTDLSRMCPSELRAGGGQGCKSACEAFGSPEYCCKGAYNTPAACRPSIYSGIFKTACPRAYSYAYDDATSTFTCSGADYTITFCPSLTSQKSSSSSGGNAVALQQAAAANDAPQPQDDFPWLPNFFNSSSSSHQISILWAILISLLCVLL